MRSIRDTFSTNFHRVAWMDDKTKARAREKARAISQMIGYPDFITNPAKLDKHYENVRNYKYLLTKHKFIEIQFHGLIDNLVKYIYIKIYYCITSMSSFRG